jgi:hypothetical protein
LKSILLSLSILLLATVQGPLPDASISGNVRNIAGTATPLGLISIGTLGYRDGRRVYLSGGSTSLVDANGNYRIAAVKAGEYYLRVESQRSTAIYYPGTAQIETATKLAVEAGQEIVGIDFDASVGPTFKISGTIRNIPASATSNGLTNALLGLTFASADLHSPDPSTGPLIPNSRSAPGEFEISLPAGEWDIFPVIPNRAAAQGAPIAAPQPGVPMYATGRARVLLRDRDIENVVITIGSADVRGRILVSGSSANLNELNNRLRVNLLPKDNYPSPLISHLRVVPEYVPISGEFSVSAVPPGRYVLRISPLPSTFYVADMRVGSKSIYDDGIITVGTEPIDPVEVVLSDGGGEVRVTPVGRDGVAVVRGTSNMIALTPIGARRENALLYKAVNAADSIRGVAPGRYKVYAFQALPPGGAEQDADFMAKYEAFGVTIDVVAGQTVDVQVPWIPAGK